MKGKKNPNHPTKTLNRSVRNSISSHVVLFKLEIPFPSVFIAGICQLRFHTATSQMFLNCITGNIFWTVKLILYNLQVLNHSKMDLNPPFPILGVSNTITGRVNPTNLSEAGFFFNTTIISYWELENSQGLKAPEILNKTQRNLGMEWRKGNLCWWTHSWVTWVISDTEMMPFVTKCPSLARK